MINKQELQNLIPMLYKELKKDLYPLYHLLFETRKEEDIERALQMEQEACQRFIEKFYNIDLEGKTAADIEEVFYEIENALTEALAEAFGPEYPNYQDAVIGMFSAFLKAYNIIRVNDVDLGI